MKKEPSKKPVGSALSEFERELAKLPEREPTPDEKAWINSTLFEKLA